jgi:hypothetical protein
LAWRSRTKYWRTSSLAGAGGRLWSPRSIRARSAAVGHDDSCNISYDLADIGRQHRSPGVSRAEVAGRRGSPPRAGGGSALARNRRSRGAARVPQAGHRPAEGARSRGGHSGTGAAKGLERGEVRPASEQDREPPAPSPNRQHSA